MFNNKIGHFSVASLILISLEFDFYKPAESELCVSKVQNS